MFASLTKDELMEVLDDVNVKYKGNLEINFSWTRSDGSRFTLKVKNKKGPGARLSLELKPTTYACWHAYGDFIDSLFKLYPKARIEIRGKRYKANTWVWEDFIVDRMNGIYMSELCHCS